MSENQNTQPAAGLVPGEAAGPSGVDKLHHYRNIVTDYQKGKAMFALRVHMWSGRKVQSETEVQAMGITDIKSYKETRSLGSKMLVPASSLQPIIKIKYQLEKALGTMATRRAKIPSTFTIPQGKIAEATTLVTNADREMRSAVNNYLDDPAGYDNDREIMIQKHMAEVGKDQLNVLVNMEMESAGPPPEGISAKEWRAQHRKAVIDRFGSPAEVAEALGLNYDTFSQEYPSKAYIRRAYGITYEVYEFPYQNKLNELVSEYEMEKLAEGVMEDNAKNRAEIKNAIVGSINAIRKTMREKGGSDKINSRTINVVRGAFDKFHQLRGMILGDTGDIARLIESCKQRFEMADSWTVEEAKSLGISDALDGLFHEANEMVIDIYREADEEGEMFVGDPSGDQDEGAYDDAQMDREMTA